MNLRLPALVLAAACLVAGEAALPSLGSAKVTGEMMHANTLEVAGLTFRDVTARPGFADGELSFNALEAKAYRGRITGSYGITLLGEQRQHTCDFELAGLDLAVLARSLGATTDQLSGRIDGFLKLNIPVGNAAAMTGLGEITVVDASLVQFPLLVNLITGNPGAAKNKDRLTVRFVIARQKVHIIFARLESPVADLRAVGKIGFDGSLDLHIVPRLAFDNIKVVPLLGSPLSDFMGFLSNKVIHAYVRGHISQPQITINPFGK